MTPAWGPAPPWTIGRALGLIGAGLLVLGAFLPWAGDGRVALDLGLLTWGDRSGLPSVALVLIGLAVLPGLGALIDDDGWPRAVSAALTALLVIAWLALGPEGRIASGSVVATIAAAVLLFAAALAAPGRTRPPATAALPRPAPVQPHAGSEVTGPAGPEVAPVQPGVVGPATEDAPTAGGPSAPRPDRAADPEATEPDHPATDGRVEVDRETLYVRAWGPTRAVCIAQAVRGAQSLWADVPPVDPMTVQTVALEPEHDEELLAKLVRRALRALDLTSMGVSELSLHDRFDGGIAGRLGFAPATITRSPVPTDLLAEDVVLARHGGAWRAELRFRV